MPVAERKADQIQLIENEIYKARLAIIAFRFDDAKMIYIEIMRMYNKLDPKNK